MENTTEGEEPITLDEIKTEFQLERMILFSDAVFAIVITLMAIEIKIPETTDLSNGGALLHELKHLLPTISAYIVSFIFIGTIWYQHLKIFALVKDYDKGLVMRNLILLFFIGLFPFGASLINRFKGSATSFFLYLCILFCCLTAQYLLYHYIVVKRPNLRLNVDLQDHLVDLKKRRFIIVGFIIVLLLCGLSYYFFTDPMIRGLVPLWLVLLVIVYRLAFRKINKKKKVSI